MVNMLLRHSKILNDVGPCTPLVATKQNIDRKIDHFHFTWNEENPIPKRGRGEEKKNLFSIIFFLEHPVTDKKLEAIFNVHHGMLIYRSIIQCPSCLNQSNEEFQRQTLFFMSFSESVTYMAEFGSLADIFPVSPCKYPVSSNDMSYDFFVRNQS